MKNAIVTGAGGGLGQHLSAELLERGYRVFGWDNAPNSFTGALARNYGERFLFSDADLSGYPAVEAAAAGVAEQAGSVDVIVNAAGILPPNSERELPEFDIDASIDVYNINALGPLRVVKALLPLLRQGDDKLVIQISSEAGSLASHMPHYIRRYDYCMSKAALNMQSVILQRYVRQDGIRVYLIHPGWMRTAMGGEQAPLLPSESAARIIAMFDGGRRPETMYMDYDGTPRPW